MNDHLDVRKKFLRLFKAHLKESGFACRGQSCFRRYDDVLQSVAMQWSSYGCFFYLVLAYQLDELHSVKPYYASDVQIRFEMLDKHLMDSQVRLLEAHAINEAEELFMRDVLPKITAITDSTRSQADLSHFLGSIQPKGVALSITARKVLRMRDVTS